MEFKVTLTVLMLLDYGGCWIVEQFFKTLFSDYKPKAIAVRRKDQLEREESRKRAEVEAEERRKEEEELARVEELEKKKRT
jgi:cation-transporting ATPase 13A1